ncbi:MAG: hypothetical protein GXO48_01520 [Chlorobi bacterium]|nr:hypothetical protein [Chlorobiota bacterium]
MNRKLLVVLGAGSSIIGILLTLVALYVHHFHDDANVPYGYLRLAGTFLFVLGFILPAIGWKDNSLLFKVIIYVTAVALGVFVWVSGIFLPESMGEYFPIYQAISQTTNSTGNFGTYGETFFWQMIKYSLLNSVFQILIPAVALYWVLSHLAEKTYISLFKFSGSFFLLSAITYTVSLHEVSDSPLLMFAYISSAVFNLVALVTYLFAWIRLLLNNVN